MRRSISAIGVVAVSIGITGPVRAQRAPAGTMAPAMLSAEELTSIRPVINGSPQWAPDGSRLMVGTSFAGSDLWTVPAAGGFPVSLNLQLGEIAFLQSHQQFYSPDGKWIAYVSNRTGYSELYLHSLEDGHEVQLTHMGARINSYSWSPDGHAIAFAGDRYGNYDIYTVAVPGGAVVRFTSDRLNEVFPTWTPDGRRVVFVQLDDRWLNHAVLGVDVGGNGTAAPQLIVQDTSFFDYEEGGMFGYPQISPDGSTLLFRSHRSGWLNYWVVPVPRGRAASDRRRVCRPNRRSLVARWEIDSVSRPVERDARPARGRRHRRRPPRPRQAGRYGRRGERGMVARRITCELHPRDPGRAG